MNIEDLGLNLKATNVDGNYIVTINSDNIILEIEHIEKVLTENGYEYQWLYSFIDDGEFEDLVQDIISQGFVEIKIWKEN